MLTALCPHKTKEILDYRKVSQTHLSRPCLHQKHVGRQRGPKLAYEPRDQT